MLRDNEERANEMLVETRRAQPAMEAAIQPLTQLAIQGQQAQQKPAQQQPGWQICAIIVRVNFMKK